MQDCRDLKNKNSDLTGQLSAAKSGTPVVATSGGTMDWETQKRLMLAQLEADFDGNDQQQQQQKLTIEQAIQKTEQAVAGKEQELAAKSQEIEELRRQLENHGSESSVRLSSAAAEVLDKDELVRQERESLKKLQDSLREQLRQAEIELSMERAKIARQRAEMEEKIQTFEADRAKFAVAADGQKNADSGKKPSRGRWLARLGLRGSDDSK
jgi:DNA repair exonuclease SbcCD ATPase subunit